MTVKNIAQIGIDSPLRQLFDYRIPDGQVGFQVGCRVRVPFGKRTIVGIIINLKDQSSVAHNRLKNVQELLDPNPLFNPELFSLIRWAAHYYQYPLGAALFAALPPALRKLNATPIDHDHSEIIWQLTPDAPDHLSRAPKQEKLLQLLKQFPNGLTLEQCNEQLTNCRPTLKLLEEKTYVQKILVETKHCPTKFSPPSLHLTEDQDIVSKSIISSIKQFSVHLLEGVTGSGKTEVYFSIIKQVLKQAKSQILILVPEIGLTPQLQDRLQKQFGDSIGLLHSNVSEKQRKQTWLRIAEGDVQIILGTRLAIFAPIPHLKLIVIDEEHDSSFKQQEGFLYHARDVAIYRAKKCNIPIILGSATPSFESLNNVSNKKYQHLLLNKRVHSDVMPRIQIADMRTQQSGIILSTPLSKAMQTHLQTGNQVILFLNRRGYAPALLCHDCGWVAQCQRCDANLTYHSHNNKLTCHHCESIKQKPALCPNCNSSNLILVGQGTQRIEEILAQQFPEYKTVRLDRDNTRRKNSLEKILKEIIEQKFQIIVGTQILSKGHDFPCVSLVGILDIDYGIHSSDFRALERNAQLLIQVSGRSGRRTTQGEVFVQTHTPDHPLLNTLLNDGYSQFAKQSLKERQEWQLPPFSHQISVRARSQKISDLHAFLNQVALIAKQHMPAEISVQGPITPAMEKRAGQYRAFILLTSFQRRLFSQHLETCLTQIEALPESRKVRWSVDVDPMDHF